MSTIDKVGIKEKLMAAIDRESLPNREAARLLNIHPCYISMIKNEKSWDGITTKVWERFNEWFQTRDLLVNFQIPEGEEIYKQKEKEVKPSGQFIKGIDDPMAKLLSDGIKKDKKAIKKKPSIDFSQEFLNLKEKEAEFMDFVALELEKIKSQFKQPSPLEGIRQKLAIDIEINLVINGQKVNL
jgi:hypothetical protein